MIDLVLRTLFVAQASALCFRDGERGREVLLVSSKSGNRWTFPKGTIEPGETSREAAVREAFEEAGVEGEISPEVLGHYYYRKGKRWWPRRVAVHALRVQTETKHFPEAGQRRMRWLPMEQAMAEVKPSVGRIAHRLP